jgi:fatty-acyl-CoA synthase
VTAAGCPLSPLEFLQRASHVYADRPAVVDPKGVLTFRDLHDRARHLAGALVTRGVDPGAKVGVLAPNGRELLEAHYGVPFAGAVLVPLNVRLGATEIAYILDHAQVDVLIYADSMSSVAAEAVGRCARNIETIGCGEHYEAALAGAEPVTVPVSDELATIAINYTSGTTGAPKGVIYTHRGAYLQSLAMAFHSGLTLGSSYLWTLPMFHCNGWCFTWAVTAAGATHVCMSEVTPPRVWEAINRHDVTHMCAAPTVLSMITFAEEADISPGRRVWVATGGAPPAPALLGRARVHGFDVTHLYGMTETYGPIVINEWRPEWNGLSEAERDRLNARQGVGNIVSSRVRVVDETGADVPADGTTIGEIAVAGNNVTPGYYRDDTATRAAIPDGWLRTGDLAVRHGDECIEIRDRAKDVIISGGENISSVEVEQALMEHPAIQEAAVVAVAHDHWGERPVAFVTVAPGVVLDIDELRSQLATRIAKFKIPDAFHVQDLPKTATGKIQKFALRAQLADATRAENPSPPSPRPPGRAPFTPFTPASDEQGAESS